MKKNLFSPLCIFVLIFVANSTQAQNFSLVKDINPSKDGNPVNRVNDLYLSFTPYFLPGLQYNTSYTLFKGVAYFAADDGVHGTEIWRSDNTASGTYMLKDINPGSGGSSIENITVAGNKLYFAANYIVYVSDGTTAGTVPVPGITYNGDATTCLTALGGNLYFLTNVSRLWKTDGTAAGTSLVIDFRQVYNGYRDFLGQLTSAGGTLYFTTGSDSYNGSELWKSDGTAGGTVLVKDIYPGTEGALPLHLTALDGKLYFTADDGTGRKLWVSNGTDAGTQKLVNNGVTFPILNSYSSADALPFTSIGKVLYFKAYSPSTGDELYKYNADNSTAGIKLVKDIIAGSDSSEPANITAVNNNVYFSISKGINQLLYITDGMETGTKLVKGLGAIAPANIGNFANANGKLFFSVYTNANGVEPWKSDGTSAGTKMIKDIFPGNNSSSPQYFTYFNNGVTLFSATDGVKGIELWSTDGSTAGTTLLKNINNITTAGSNPQLYSNTGVLNSKLFFTASSDIHANALYVSDGTDAGTKMLDLNNGNSPAPSNFTLFKDHMYFSAIGADGNISLFKSDGTVGGTKSLLNEATAGLPIVRMIAAQDYLYVFYNDVVNSTTQLWTSDGSSTGFKLIQTIALQSTYDGIALGNTLYFTGYDNTHGSELWKAKSTTNSASLVADIVPGTGSSYIGNFIVYHNKVYFIAYDAGNVTNVYTSNGTEAGTKKLSAVKAAQVPMIVANDKLFFVGNDGNYGNVLFVSAGTEATTHEIFDKITNSPVQISEMIAFNNKAFCSGYDAIYGPEIFKSDGTNAGTTVVKDIDSSPGGAYPGQLRIARGRLYFKGGGNLYNQLWVTDGSADGTMQVTDAGLSGVTPNALVGSDNLLFIAGYNYAYGSELYAGSVQGVQPANAIAAKQLQKIPALTVNILGNPVQDKINLTITTVKSQAVSVLLSDASGKIMFVKKEFVSTGTNSISYTANTLTPGVYNLKIIAEDGSFASLNLIK